MEAIGVVVQSVTGVRGINASGQFVQLVALGVASLSIFATGILVVLTVVDDANPAAPHGIAPVEASAEPDRPPWAPAHLDPPRRFRIVEPSATDTPAVLLAGLLRAGGGEPVVTQAVLRDLGFKRVTTRAWRSAREELLVATYEFSEAGGARAFRDLLTDATRADGARPISSSPRDGHGWVLQLRASQPPAQVALLDEDDESYVVALVGTSAAPGSRLLEEVLAAGPRRAGAAP